MTVTVNMSTWTRKNREKYPFFGDRMMGQSKWVVLSVILLALAEGSRGPHHQWNQIKLSGDLPGRRKMHGVAAAGQRLFIYGGYRSGGIYLDDLYEIEPSSGVSTQLVSPPHVTPLGRRLMVSFSSLSACCSTVVLA